MLKEVAEDQLFVDVEMPLVKVLADVERNGVVLNEEILSKMSEELEKESNEEEQKVYELAGVEFNLASPKQLGEVYLHSLRKI